MSYNGSGTFNINTAGQPVVAGTIISSASFNALTADLATGLTTAITKDGQTATTARIPFAQGINSTLVTDASSTTTGSIITAGGVGIAKKLYIGGEINYGGVTLTNGVTGTGKMVLDTAPTIASANFTTALTLAGAAGTNGQVLTSAGSGLPSWTTFASSIVRSARTSNTILGTTDASTLIDITSGTFSQTFTAAATLGSGWFCYIQNSGTGYVTLDPNGAETITRNGVAHTTWVLWPKEIALIVCNGTGFFYTNLQKGQIVQTLGTQVSVEFATGVAYRTRLDMTLEGISVDTSAILSVKLNTSTNSNKTSQIIITSTSLTSNTANTTNFNYMNNTASSWALNQTGEDRMFGQITMAFGSIGTVLNGWGFRLTSSSTQEYQYHAGFFDAINATNVTSLGLYLASGNLTGGTITITEL